VRDGVIYIYVFSSKGLDCDNRRCCRNYSHIRLHYLQDVLREKKSSIRFGDFLKISLQNLNGMDNEIIVLLLFFAIIDTILDKRLWCYPLVVLLQSLFANK